MVSKKKETELEKNKALAHRLHQEIIQKPDLDLADEIIAPDCVVHSPIRDVRTSARGPEIAKQMARHDQEIFPGGLKFEHSETLAEGNLVAFRWVIKGTIKTGETREGHGIDIIRIENGKIAEVWVEYDRMGSEERRRGEGKEY